MRARLTFNFSFNVSQSSIQMFMTTWLSPHNQLFQWILIKACLFNTKHFQLSKWNTWHDVTIVHRQSGSHLVLPLLPCPTLALPGLAHRDDHWQAQVLVHLDVHLENVVSSIQPFSTKWGTNLALLDQERYVEQVLNCCSKWVWVDDKPVI